MKSKRLICICVIVVLPALARPVGLAGQANPSQHKPKQHKYKLIDLGTLGGQNSQVNGGPPPMLNNEGTVAGMADTSSCVPTSLLLSLPRLGGRRGDYSTWDCFRVAVSVSPTRSIRRE
jgi:hypothetical protein